MATTMWGTGNGPNNVAYLLYDPDKGTNDYFLVENREQGTYDAQSSDKGLVLWQVEDSKEGTPRGAFELVRPGSNVQTPPKYGGSSVDAWDPTDSLTPQRTMMNNWLDGTPAKVAVRAIHGKSGWVYLDVRGAGILVDGYGLTETALIGGTTTITFPVMNTGEQSDTFEFRFIDKNPLPPGFSQTSDVQTLGAGQAGTAHIKLTIAPNTPAGKNQFAVDGKSTTTVDIVDPDGSYEKFRAYSYDDITVDVQKRPTRIEYTGDTTADYSDPAHVSAKMTDVTTGDALSNMPIKFSIGSQSATFLTDSSGVASGDIVLDQPAASTSVVASFAGDGTYKSSSSITSFTIMKETLSLAYTGNTLVGFGTVPTLSVAGTQQADGYLGDLSLATVSFSLMPTLTVSPFLYSAAMTTSGTANVGAVGLPVDIWQVTATVPADNLYWRSATTAPVELVLYDPNALFTGDASGNDFAGAVIATKFTALYNGNVPKGSETLTFSGGSFSAGNGLDWIVKVGNVAIFQIKGKLNGNSATLRMRVLDSGQPGRGDTFRAMLGSYDSGVVKVADGNLKSH